MQSGKFTLAIIAANILFFVISFALEYFFGFKSYLFFGLNPYFFEGMPWQLLSSFFMHGGVMHLAMNMAVLYQFGGILERAFGGIKFTHRRRATERRFVPDLYPLCHEHGRNRQYRRR